MTFDTFDLTHSRENQPPCGTTARVGRAHPDDVRTVTAANRDRLIGIARSVAAITEPMDLGGSK